MRRGREGGGELIGARETEMERRKEEGRGRRGRKEGREGITKGGRGEENRR